MHPIPPRQTLLLILAPMLGVVGVTRLYLHIVGVTHIYPGGYLLHHLFAGVLFLIPAAFVLAFGPHTGRSAVRARVAVGVGSGLVLDEMTFLIMTKATDEDYVSAISLLGSIGFLTAAVVLLWLLYRSRRGQ